MATQIIILPCRRIKKMTESTFCFCAGSQAWQFRQGSHPGGEGNHRGLHQNKQRREVGHTDAG